MGMKLFRKLVDRIIRRIGQNRRQILKLCQANENLIRMRNDAWAESRRLCAERDSDIANHVAEWQQKCARLENMWAQMQVENLKLRGTRCACVVSPCKCDICDDKK